MRVELIFAEFDRPPVNVDRFLRWFPGATARVITDPSDGPQFDGPRRGWRLNDYWKARGLLESKAEVAIALDADMEIVSRDADRLPHLSRKFGLCLPANPRWTVRTDQRIGADTAAYIDDSNGTGPAVNCSPIALYTRHGLARQTVQAFCWIMECEPARGPLNWWAAFWETGFGPLILPPQWCVCQEHVGIGGEIMLHTGHQKVREYYGVKAA